MSGRSTARLIADGFLLGVAVVLVVLLVTGWYGFNSLLVGGLFLLFVVFLDVLSWLVGE